MKVFRTKSIWVIVMFIVIGFLPFTALGRPLQGCNEAITAAQSFLEDVLEQFGDWGGEPSPYIKECQELKNSKNRTVGYIVSVNPKGYIALNKLTQLTPVVAYSETSNLNITSDKGMAGLLKDYMGATIDYLEQKYGKLETVPETGVAPDTNKELWNYYLKTGPRPQRDQGTVKEPLLTTRWDNSLASFQSQDATSFGPGLAVSWHQGTPFNNNCPIGCSGNRTVVGCVATAAAQIMKYWQYPHSGIGSHTYYWDGDTGCGGYGAQNLSATFSDSYDWANMLDDYSSGYNSTQAAAVAELCYEVGVAFEMDYGVGGSSATTADAATVFPNYFRYANTTSVLYRSSYTNSDWFNLIRKELDAPLPRPIQYRIHKSGWGGHSVVCDGYNTTNSMIHINYGWDDAHTAWYTLDNLYCGSGDPCPANDQYMVVGIQPINRVYIMAKELSNTTLYYMGPFPTGTDKHPIGATTHAPSIAVFNNKEYIAVKGDSNNEIYLRSKDGRGSWSSWVVVGGQTNASPTLVAYNNRLYLFVKGIDNKIYYKYMDSSGTWSAYSSVPGWSSSDSIGAAVQGDKLWIFGKGSGSSTTIYYRYYQEGSGWSATSTLAGATSHGPTAVTHTDGKIHFFARGTNGAVYYRTYSTSWSSWSNLGGYTPSRPSAATRPDSNTLYATVRGGNNGIYYRSWNGSSWSSWQSYSGSTTSDTPVVTTFYYYDP